MIWLLAVCLLLGHFSIFVAFINRLHGTATPRPILKTIDLLWNVWFFGIPILAGVKLLQAVVHQTPFQWQSSLGRLGFVYGSCCLAAAIVAVVHRGLRIANRERTPLLTSNHTRLESMTQRLGHRPTADPLTTALSMLPLNEVLMLSVHEKVIHLPRLNEALNGFTITHLSDLHFTGQLSRSFYNEVVDQANAFGSDVIVITGDILEQRDCLPWIKDTLGRLQAELGVYFVLGNHELRLYNEQLARRTLTDAGLTDLGGKWVRVDYHDSPIVLAGNELPWFPPAADMQSVPAEMDGQRPLLIALCHTPDQLAWSQAHEFDLMLAGHTHGGQVRLPLIGPILAPSVFGTRHASGTFYHEPTLLHVSRGLAGTRPLRFRCPPELTQLVLQSP